MGARRADDPALFFEAHIFVCCNRRPDGHPRGSCAAKGSEHLRDYMKARGKELGLTGIRVNTAGCLDRCELGPTLVVYPEAIWYRIDSPAAVDAVLAEHVQGGGRATALMLDAGASAGAAGTPDDAGKTGRAGGAGGDGCGG